MSRSTITSLVAITLLAACAPPASDVPVSFDRATATVGVSSVLDALHHNASIADEEAYFGLFAPEGVFLGTDATERWTLEQFRAYAHGPFSEGRGWTYILREGTRMIEFSPDGSVAWFDEILDNENYGETRGTGVLRWDGDDWKIAQYHLVIPVPNDLASDLVERIRSSSLPATE